MKNVLVTLALLFSLACSGNPGPSVGSSPSKQAPPQIYVENRNFADATIYVVYGTYRTRLGFVGGMTNRSFNIPRSIPEGATIYLLMDPVGSRQVYISDTIFLTRGLLVEWRLAPNLTFSTVFMRVINED